MRLDLGAANAIQTYSTVRELRRLMPGMRLVIPRWLGESSAFTNLNALHLPRPAVNKLSKFVPWSGWSYIERTLYSFMLVSLLVIWRATGRGYRALYVRDSVLASWLARLSALHGAKVVYEVHDLEASHPSKASKWPRVFWAHFLPWLDKGALHRSAMLISLTATFKAWAVEHRIRRPDEIAVIPDAFDPDLYYPVDMLQARRTLRLPDSAFIVGYAGLTFAYRRLDLLVEAFASLTESDALLVLVGGRANEVAGVQEQVSRLGISSDKVILTGQLRQEQAALYMNAADVLVIPDTVTGMTASPLKLFEYMAVGKPLVCKDMPALREIVDDNAALFFPAGNSVALGHTIERLQKNLALRRTMGDAARSMSQGYTYKARARKILEVVESCL